MTRFPSLARALAAVTLASVSGACAPGIVPGGPPAPAEIPALEEHIRAQPEDRDARARLGAVYLEVGRSDLALRALGPAATADPPHPAAIFLHAGALEGEERWVEARTEYERYLEVAEDDRFHPRVRERLELIRRREVESEVREALAREGELADRAPDPAAVAVFPFHYEGTDPRYLPLGRALAEMVVTDLAQVGRVRVLERLRLQILLDEMALAEDERVDPATAARSGRLLGAGRVVQGRIHGDEELMGVVAGVVAAPEGTEVGTVVDEDPLQAFFDLQKRLVVALFDRMDVELTPAERERVLERPTESLQALLLYGRALEAEDRGDFAQAADLYAQAAAEDPGFTQAEQGAERAGALEIQSATPMASFSAPLVEGLPPGPTPFITPAEVRAVLQGVDDLVPGPEERDTGPDFLGVEGVVPGAAILEIILRRP